MKLIYVASPYRGDTLKNVEFAKNCCQYVINQNHNFYCPHLILPEFLNDDIPREREKALIMGKQMMFKCDELWIFGEEISQGMLEEVAFSRNLNIKIRRVTTEEVMKNYANTR